MLSFCALGFSKCNSFIFGAFVWTFGQVPIYLIDILIDLGGHRTSVYIFNLSDVVGKYKECQERPFLCQSSP